jgi:hypothetical protein
LINPIRILRKNVSIPINTARSICTTNWPVSSELITATISVTRITIASTIKLVTTIAWMEIAKTTLLPTALTPIEVVEITLVVGVEITLVVVVALVVEVGLIGEIVVEVSLVSTATSVPWTTEILVAPLLESSPASKATWACPRITATIELPGTSTITRCIASSTTVLHRTSRWPSPDTLIANRRNPSRVSTRVSPGVPKNPSQAIARGNLSTSLNNCFAYDVSGIAP